MTTEELSTLSDDELLDLWRELFNLGRQGSAKYSRSEMQMVSKAIAERKLLK